MSSLIPNKLRVVNNHPKSIATAIKPLDVDAIVAEQVDLLKSYMDYTIPEKLTVAVVCPTRKYKHINQFLTNLSNQTYQPKQTILLLDNYPEEEKVILNNLINLLGLNVNVLEDNSTNNVGTRTNLLVEQADTDIVLRMDDDDLYYPHYIEYKLKSLLKHDVSLTGNKTILTKDVRDGSVGLYLPDYNRGNSTCISGTICFHRDEYLRVGGMGDELQRSGNYFQNKLVEKGGTLTSSDMFNYLLVRWVEEGHLTPFTTIYSKLNPVDLYIVGDVI